MRFYISAHGVKQAVEEIEGIALRATDTRPAMEEIYLTILDIEQEAFDKEGERSGFPKWVKNTLSTIVAKHGAPILVESGRMRDAMTTYRSPDATTRIHKDYIVFAPNTTKIPYGRIQRKGGKAGKVIIPARDYIRFSKADSTAFAKEISRHLMRRRGPGKISVSAG